MLTRDELKWLRRVQRALDACPSDRLGFYTTGDRNVTVFDTDKSAEIDAAYDTGGEFCNAVDEADAGLGELNFPSGVQSTAG